MEIVFFYGLNILVGAVLAIVLGLFGAHVVARNKTVEIVLLGQGIQVGILIGYIVTALYNDNHDDHGLHFEILVSVIFTMILYSIYSFLTRSKGSIKTPVLILGYTLLLATSYLVVAISPLVESHMVKAFLGDIVTASKVELKIILVFSIAAFGFFMGKRKTLRSQSFEISLFDHLQSSEGKCIHYLFNTVVMILMIYSIHVLGIVFTLCMMILPITLIQFAKSGINGLFYFILICAPLSVFGGFLLNIKYENMPTSPLIALLFLIFGVSFSLLSNFKAN